MFAQTARVPPQELRLNHLVVQVVLLGLGDQNLRLPHQTRDVRDTSRSGSDAVTISTRASSYKTFARARMDSLHADVARLALGVFLARVGRDLDGLLILFVGVVLFCVAAAVYFLADLLMPAAPVVVLASGIAVSCFAPHTFRGVVGQWRGAGGAVCEDHVAFAFIWWEESRAAAGST